MLQVQSISKSYGALTVLNEVSFVINPGERAALVGPNGVGKTTLLRIIAAEEHPDSGSVILTGGTRLGYLPQGLAFEEEGTVGNVLRSGVEDFNEAYTNLKAVELQLEAGLSELDAYHNAYEHFDRLGGYTFEAEIEAVRAHLDLAQINLDAPVSALSGGQITRLGLARILLTKPDVLLLDEPTNHLDIDAIEWLESFIATYRGAVLMVSHDREFMDRTISAVIALDEATHRAGVFPGNYSDYVTERERRIEDQWARYADQLERDKRLEAAIRRITDQADSYQGMTKNDFQRRKSRVLMQKAMAQKTRLEKALNDKDRVEKPRPTWELKVDFGEMPRSGTEVLRIEGAGHSYVSENFLFRGVELLLRHGERVVLIGPNGSGKSTLLRAIVGELELAEGTIVYGANVRIGYLPQNQEWLDPDTNPYELIRANATMSETEIRKFLHHFLFAGDDVFIPAGKLSYGIRSRLLLAKMIVQGANCLVLDEPLNHLDVDSREKFEAALMAFPGTVLGSAHDRAFIRRFASGVWHFDGGRVQPKLSAR